MTKGIGIAAVSLLIVSALSTGVWASPTVTFTDPAAGATSVPPGSSIQATFSEAMDANSINPQTFAINRTVKVKSIAAGSSFSIALKTDGTVGVWGWDLTSYDSLVNYGILDVPPGLKDVTAVAAGDQHCVALKKDGTVVNWGSNAAQVPAGLTGVTAIAAGSNGFTLALKSDGTVVSWGTWARTNTDLAGKTGIVAIAASSNAAVLLKNDGTVEVVGGTAPPTGLARVGAIAAGQGHFLAMKCDGTVVAWGANGDGQCNVPAGLTDVVSIAAGVSGYHSVALKRDGTVVTWGRAAEGQSAVPAGLAGAKAIAAGHYHTLAIKDDCTVAIWGKIPWAPAPGGFVPATVPVESNEIVAISAESSTTLAAKRDGTIVAWGDNYYHQAEVPAGLTDVVSVAGGQGYSLALKKDGTTVGWGNSAYTSLAPAGLSGVAAIAVGNYALALKEDGTVVVWGPSSYAYPTDVTVVPATVKDIVAISSTGAHALALTRSGTVIAWGDNRDHQCDVPAGLTDVVAISAGIYHSVALKKDGTVVAWGRNSDGQSSVPVGLTNVAEISAGQTTTAVAKRDGTVVWWGTESPYSSTIKFPTRLHGVAKLSGAAAAVKADGGMIVWGSNFNGRCYTPFDYRYGNLYESQTAGALTYDPSMNSASFTPSASLEPALYSADMSTVRSATGGKLLAPVKWTFATADYDPATNYPCAGSSSPAVCLGWTSFNITATVQGGQGTLTCTTPVTGGTDSTCQVVPSPGYGLSRLTDNGQDVTSSVSGSIYLIHYVTQNHAVAATFSDVEKPVVTAPPNVTVEATGPLTTVNIGTATATDNVGVVSITNNAPAQFEVRSTEVTWSAIDAAGNIGTATQTVTVTDTTKPVLSGLANQVVEATSAEGAVVRFTVTASDLVDGTDPVSCVTDTGTVFPLGTAGETGAVFPIRTTTVTCTATDSHSNSVTGSFTVKVQDTTAPLLTVPADIDVVINTPLSAPDVDSFLNAAIATDAVDTSVTVTHSTVPTLDTVGPKEVIFTAVDDYGNTVSHTATIHVIYGCGEFVEPANLLTPFKQESVIPVKLHLCDASGVDLNSRPKLYLQPLCGGQVIQPVSNDMREAGDKYLYNVQTHNVPAGQYLLEATLDDRTVKTVTITIEP